MNKLSKYFPRPDGFLVIILMAFWMLIPQWDAIYRHLLNKDLGNLSSIPLDFLVAPDLRIVFTVLIMWALYSYMEHEPKLWHQHERIWAYVKYTSIVALIVYFFFRPLALLLVQYWAVIILLLVFWAWNYCYFAAKATGLLSEKHHNRKVSAINYGISSAVALIFAFAVETSIDAQGLRGHIVTVEVEGKGKKQLMRVSSKGVMGRDFETGKLDIYSWKDVKNIDWGRKTNP